jgi:hypothetical protein
MNAIRRHGQLLGDEGDDRGQQLGITVHCSGQ